MPLPFSKRLINQRMTPDGEIEDTFRCAVRMALGLDLFTRDDQIINEIERLKKLETESKDL